MIDPSAVPDATAPLDRRPDVRRTGVGAAIAAAPRAGARPHEDRTGDAPSATGPDVALTLSPASLRLAAEALPSPSASPPPGATPGDAVTEATSAAQTKRAARSPRDEPDPAETSLPDPSTAASDRRDRPGRIVDAYRAVEKAPLGMHVRVVA